MAPTKLKLEAGKCYKTRSGKKEGFVQGLTNPFDNEFSDKKAYGFVADDDINDVTWWAPDGAYFVSEHPLDLVAEWVEPKRIRSR